MHPLPYTGTEANLGRTQKTRRAMQLIKQWDRIAEKHGVLYRKCTNTNGHDHLQLLLPVNIRDDLLKREERKE